MFQPGVSGNPTGRPKSKPFKDALNLAVKRAGIDQTKIQDIANKLVELAVDGDVSAIKEVADRLEGKPAQTQILQGDEDGGPVKVSRIEIVAATNDDGANTSSA